MNEFMAGEWGRGLLLEYVFLEVVTVLLARRDLSVASAVGARLLQAREIDFVPCSELFLDTFEIFRSQARAGLSFTDSAIIAAMRRYGAQAVATFDTGFQQIQGISVVPQ
jgi:predicted nucleic acid-binding protein